MPPTNAPVFLLGWSRNLLGDARREIPAFAIGRREVTNAEFKAFVDAGGYDNDAYWDGLAYVSNGQELDAKDARARFVDLTERPGPAGWEAGWRHQLV